MSELTVSIHAEALLARLNGAGAKLDERMRTALDRLSIEIQNLVKDKLNGPVLSVRTGTLRRSINREITQDAGGLFATIGTNVRYAAAHEYGFSGTVTVNSYERKTPSGGTAPVRSHSRTLNLPERSFLRSTLREQADKIKNDLRAAALEAIRQ